MLTEARDLTNSHGAVLVRGGVVMELGAGQELVELRQRLTCGKGLRRSEPHPVELSDGSAVVAVLGEGAGQGCPGFARRSGARYSTGDLQLMDAVVAAINTLMSLTDLQRRSVQRAAIDREHQRASNLAQAILPTARLS